MKLLELLRRETHLPLRKLLVIASVSGLSNALVMATLNRGAAQAAEGRQGWGIVVLFSLLVIVYAFGVRYFMQTATHQVELLLDRIRIRLGDKVRRCDLGPLEQIGTTVIYAGITKETSAISQAALGAIVALQSAILIGFTSFYVAALSLVAFLLTALAAVLIARMSLRRNVQMNREQHETLQRENELFDLLTHMLDGFKEVRLNRARSDDLFQHFVRISTSARRLKIRTMAAVTQSFVISQVSFFSVMGLIVFVVPRFSETYSADIVKISAAVLFLAGPLGGLISTIPSISASNAAVENLVRLEALLDQSLSARAYRTYALPPLRTFREISLEHVVYRYGDESGATFSVGPIDFVIEAGETVFIAGGNGSGKSTFLKLFTSLYFPQAGVIRLDGQVVRADSYEAYRSLFSTVFTDFHLFDRMYGLYGVAEEEVNRQLDMIEMTGKTRVADLAFETLDLSTGQRKRLALAISILEDRAIYIFDEMAADQDPAFRRKFYKEILPLLKKAGKTVVAVTHDDKYFDDADRLLKMEDGRLIRYEHALHS